MAPGWRARLLAGERNSLAWMLRDAAGIEVVTGDAALEAAALRYDGAVLRGAETEREQARQAQLARNRQRFVDGPVLVLDLQDMKVQFDPRTLEPLGGIGMVYPTLRITDEWGVLEVDDGALMRSDWSAVIVGAPEVATMPWHGEGWTLVLNPGWQLVPGERAGDWKLSSAEK